MFGRAYQEPWILTGANSACRDYVLNPTMTLLHLGDLLALPPWVYLSVISVSDIDGGVVSEKL